MKKQVVTVIAALGAALSVHASEVVNLKLDSNANLHWYQGQYFKLCDETDAQCVQLKMPKAVTPIEKLDVTKNMDGAKATWLVYSGKTTFICAVAEGSTQVNCGRVLSERAQAVKQRAKLSSYARAMTETRKVLAAELKLARAHSIWWFWESACNECEDRNEDITDNYNDCTDDARDTSSDNAEERCEGQLTNATHGDSSLTFQPVDQAACYAQVESEKDQAMEQCQQEKDSAISQIDTGGLSGCAYTGK